MLDDKTVIKPRAVVQFQTVLVKVMSEQGKQLAEQVFTRSFTVGRARDNDIHLEDDRVSRKHLAINLESDGCWLHHLKSTNGVYINGRLIADKEKLTLPVSIGLGKSGLTLTLQNQYAVDGSLQSPVQQGNISSPLSPQAMNVSKKRSPADIEARLLAPEDTNDMGEYTLMVRKVIRQDRVVQGKRYQKVIWLLVGLFIIVSGLAVYQKWL